jgi:hypothetical protein
MAFGFRKDKDQEAKPLGHGGGWYPDPYGTAARRWYDPRSGWSDRVEEEGQEPDKTGMERLDDAATAPDESTRPVDGDGEPVPLSRPVDGQYMDSTRK